MTTDKPLTMIVVTWRGAEDAERDFIPISQDAELMLVV